jgi:hypothetical protein
MKGWSSRENWNSKKSRLKPRKEWSSWRLIKLERLKLNVSKK